MENSNKETLQPRVLLSWPIPPDYVPPPQFSDRQVTVCPKEKVGGYGLGYVNRREGLVECPEGDYDLYDFVQQSEQIVDKEFDLVIVRASSCEHSNPFNTKKFGCPTVLLAGTTHHCHFPIQHLLAYWAVEAFDYVVTAHNRQHLHWFAAAGAENLAWLPLISMHTVVHKWIEARESQVVFIGHQGSGHPRRSRLVEAIKRAHLPILAKTANRQEAARLFAESLISFNCSMNGDLNLRNLEVISAGGFLLTDKLSFASGFDEYLSPGLYCDVYSSELELVEKIKFYLENPGLALEIAKRAYEKFLVDWHPKHRIADLMNWVFKGELPNFYAAKSDPRFFISTAYRDLVNTRLAIYEPVQELHRVEEQLKVLVSKDCPVAVVADLLDLPRLEVYAEAGFPVSELPKDERVVSRVHVWEEESSHLGTATWDVLIARSNSHLTSRLLPYSKFVFVLDEQNQLVFSNATKLANIARFSLGATRADGSSWTLRLNFYKEEENVALFTIDEIFSKQPYPFLNFVDGVSIIVDVGANIGIASAYFRMLYPNATILCFEPDPLALHLLKLNSLDIGGCTVYPFGLYSDDITKTFYSSLVTACYSSIHKNQYADFPRVVQLVKASSFLGSFLKSVGAYNIDILKIDTEGSETQILKDLFEILVDIKIIYLEFHSEEDRRLIDQILCPTHVLYKGNIVHTHRGTLCYLSRRHILHDVSREPLRSKVLPVSS
jgi:FkbM family methyltransferase